MLCSKVRDGQFAQSDHLIQPLRHGPTESLAPRQLHVSPHHEWLGGINSLWIFSSPILLGPGPGKDTPVLYEYIPGGIVAPLWDPIRKEWAIMPIILSWIQNYHDQVSDSVGARSYWIGSLERH
jgi:hypothetical protein